MSRLWCFLFGHDWAPGLALPVCARCGWDIGSRTYRR